MSRTTSRLGHDFRAVLETTAGVEPSRAEAIVERVNQGSSVDVEVPGPVAFLLVEALRHLSLHASIRIDPEVISGLSVRIRHALADDPPWRLTAMATRREDCGNCDLTSIELGGFFLSVAAADAAGPLHYECTQGEFPHRFFVRVAAETLDRGHLTGPLDRVRTRLADRLR